MAFLVSVTVLLAGTWLFIVLIDPFDTLNLSPPLDRQPVSNNQRWVYPALARKTGFDSVVCGSSSVRLLEPRLLDKHLGGSFLNVAMNASKREEQFQILRVFVRSHPDVRTLILGIDSMWRIGAEGAVPLSPHPLPEWMYDEDPWNDYAEHFNFYALKHAWGQLLQVLDHKEPRFGPDGYTNFLPPSNEYDLEKIRKKIDADGAKAMRWGNAQYTFALDLLDRTLDLFPASTEKILVLPPTHFVTHGDLVRAKKELMERVRSRPNLRVLDFMFESRWTTTDSNYWDILHYNVEIASQIVRLVAESRDPGFASDVCRVLVR